MRPQVTRTQEVSTRTKILLLLYRVCQLQTIPVITIATIWANMTKMTPMYWNPTGKMILHALTTERLGLPPWARQSPCLLGQGGSPRPPVALVPQPVTPTANVLTRNGSSGLDDPSHLPRKHNNESDWITSVDTDVSSVYICEWLNPKKRKQRYKYNELINLTDIENDTIAPKDDQPT